MDHPPSSVVSRAPCPACVAAGGDTAGNNLALYDDGHGYCFACSHYVADAENPGETKAPTKEPPRGLLQGTIRDLTARRITAETCARYGYLVGENEYGTSCQIAPYRDASGAIVAQKLRYKEKGRGMPWVGDTDNVVLFGQHLQGRGKCLFVTEGELDALSLSQALGNSWPVVSIAHGAKHAAKDLLAQQAFLRGFEKVVLVLDNDDPGRKAAEEAAKALLAVVPVHVAQLPLKDASDMLVAGRVKELVDAVWGAPKFAPKGILRVRDARPKVRERISMGHPWPFRTLTELTYGRHPGQVAVTGAGAGCGKTTFVARCQALDVLELGLPTAIFSSEQTPAEILREIATAYAKVRFNVPGADYPDELLEEILDRLDRADRLFLYDRSETFKWDALRDNMRYLATGEGVRSFYLDNLTATTAAAEDERRELDATMAEAAGLMTTTGAMLHAVSHLTTPKQGPPHEEGGRVTGAQFTGSRAIIRWAHQMFGLERNTQAEDETERQQTTFRILKERLAGTATGRTFPLWYNPETGEMSETRPFAANTEF